MSTDRYVPMHIADDEEAQEALDLITRVDPELGRLLAVDLDGQSARDSRTWSELADADLPDRVRRAVTTVQFALRVAGRDGAR